MEDTNRTKCELAFQLVTHPVYRLAMLWTFLISLIAAPGLLYFLLKRLFQLPFHGNLKALLISYFLVTFLLASDLCFAFGYHFFVPFFVTSKCSLIIEISLFKWVHVTTLLLMTIAMVIPVGFSIERFVAIGMAHNYERVRTALGPFLALVLIGTDAVMIHKIYRNETFADSFVSFILIPSTSAQELNDFFWLLLFVDIFNFFCNCVLLAIHNHLKRSYLSRKSSLSLKYEMEEIFQSSKFTLIVSFTNILFIGLYLVSILFVRTVDQSFFNGYINYTVARGVYMSVPMHNLTIVIVGFLSLRRLNTKRLTKIQSNIRIKATGCEGARNYEDAITKCWDTVSSQKMTPI